MAEQLTKKCSSCKLPHTLDNFFKKKGAKYGVASYCKKCSVIKAAEWRLNNQEQYHHNQSLYQKTDKYAKLVRRSHLKRSYNMSLEDYDLLLESQNGSCAICDETREKMCVDHDHTTGRVRGILCNECNIGLGKFKDSLILIQKAERYLSE